VEVANRLFGLLHQRLRRVEQAFDSRICYTYYHSFYYVFSISLPDNVLVADYGFCSVSVFCSNYSAAGGLHLPRSLWQELVISIGLFPALIDECRRGILVSAVDSRHTRVCLRVVDYGRRDRCSRGMDRNVGRVSGLSPAVEGHGGEEKVKSETWAGRSRR
jgi:hypothetical protein